MNVSCHEALAQAMFWFGVGCLPLAVGLFFMAYSKRKLSYSLMLFALGGLALTHFAWYFVYLGQALANKVGEVPPISWPRFLPIGIVVAMGLACIKLYLRHKRNIREHRQPAPRP